ncbi:MAG: biotin/lipoyl-containing protein [Sulfurihydrogenibium azorense]
MITIEDLKFLKDVEVEVRVELSTIVRNFEFLLNIKEGDIVEKDQELCELVTSKATFPLESPENGKIIKILKEKNSKVKIGEELALLEVE